MTETATVRQTLGKFHLSGTGDLVYTAGENRYVISNQPVMQPVHQALIYGRDQGVQPVFPSYMGKLDVYEALAEALYVVSISHAKVLNLEAKVRGDVEQYKARVRTNLLDSWGDHKNHISRSSLNDFLRSLDLDEVGVLVKRATVRVWAYQDVQIDDFDVFDVEDEDDVVDAVKEEAQENVDRYNWEIDDDKTEIEEDSLVVED